MLDDTVCYLVEPDPASLARGLLAALSDDVGSAARASDAVKLYDREYARPVYEHKIRRLLALIS